MREGLGPARPTLGLLVPAFTTADRRGATKMDETHVVGGGTVGTSDGK